ncbi:PaaX family transcriptional regulator C-terminal domain-containing protein [Vannielia litorea]|uniref:PaaX family transcriptional regulator C-terminal domain-containing protein n=1 Tax=Vannielia litorea TaxID=1217970 RepID=UPI001C96C1E7|nr:PaaX family transcriptional regulator C-terminal domain-containing protein [Vannielia litorea]MBY6046545.1 PaaX family transcriptional regulator [Vannielia litorea]MBY6073958.1 PaaX family transcriptional regulator [Vannielia litorea]
MSAAPEATDLSPEFLAAAAPLRPGEHRVWSLIVTVFGDLARAEGAEIEGAALGRIMAAMAVKPEAMRVALHRLRKEGWIESRKAGRGAVHRLTEAGRAGSEAAAPRIYAARAEGPEQWFLALSEGPAEAGPGEVQLTTSAVLSPAPRSDCAAGRVDALPGWVQARLCSEELFTEAARLEQALAAVRVPEGLAPLEVAALRALVVHSWRRVVLKAPQVPPRFMPDGWAGERCRSLVVSLLAALPRPEVGDV